MQEERSLNSNARGSDRTEEQQGPRRSTCAERSHASVELESGPQAIPLDMPRLLQQVASNVSLPSVGTSTVHVQHIQSPSEMFSALAVIAFFQASLSVALFSFYNDVFSDFQRKDLGANVTNSFDQVVSRVISLSLGSVLLGIYTGPVFLSRQIRAELLFLKSSYL